jgi:hypothetical protein
MKVEIDELSRGQSMIMHTVPELEKQVKELNSILRRVYEKLPDPAGRASLDAHDDALLKAERERILFDLLRHPDTAFIDTRDSLAVYSISTQTLYSVILGEKR